MQKCKEWYKSKMAEIAAGREELADKENALKREMLKYEKFVQENDLKRHRGERKTEEERKIQARKDTEITQLRSELQYLEERRAEMQKAVNSNSKFGDFLARAIACDPDYAEVTDLLSRCDALWATRQELLSREQRDTQTLDQETLSLIAASEQLNTHVLRLNNRISDLHQRYERAQAQFVSWESTWTHIKTTAAKQTLQLGQVKMAIHNLYRLCRRYHRQRALEHEEVVEHTEPADQMATIADLMQDITAVHSECCRRAKQATARAAAQEGQTMAA